MNKVSSKIIAKDLWQSHCFYMAHLILMLFSFVSGPQMFKNLAISFKNPLTTLALVRLGLEPKLHREWARNIFFV